MSRQQFNLDFPTVLSPAAYEYGERSSGETHGVVHTKAHVVNLMLDLARYLPTIDLGCRRLLEPSCGLGAFVMEAVHRLVISAKTFNRELASLGNAIRAYDIDPEHVAVTKQNILEILSQHDVTAKVAETLTNEWIICADFLLENQEEPFDFVAGNPPYVRIEQISVELQAEYRRRYVSLYDRADLYVAFIERGLNLLSNNGKLALICADRWILNKYGAPLRRLLSERFQVLYYVDLHRASPFDSDVIAYPSIFVISPGTTGRVQVAALDTASSEECGAVLPMISGKIHSQLGVRVSVYNSWFKEDEPWVITTPDHLRALRSLEERFHLIEADGTRVGIGVATGNDRIFIVDADADIEEDRLVPLVMREDLDEGKIKNARRRVINAFNDGGGVVELSKYPRLSKHLTAHADQIRKRHVAQKSPDNWFRTIDRVYPALVSKPKLLIPDIAGSNEVILDEGQYYPHHNLYFVTSKTWDMGVLGGLLSSRVALFFVWSYAVKMRGGYLRFQAQYLRRIRLPDPTALSKKLSTSISKAFIDRNFEQLDTLALQAYGIDELPHFDFVDTRS